MSRPLIASPERLSLTSASSTAQSEISANSAVAKSCRLVSHRSAALNALRRRTLEPRCRTFVVRRSGGFSCQHHIHRCETIMGSRKLSFATPTAWLSILKFLSWKLARVSDD